MGAVVGRCCGASVTPVDESRLQLEGEKRRVTCSEAVTETLSQKQNKEDSQSRPGYVIRETDNVLSKYAIAEQIGTGQYGVVSVAIDRKTGEKIAIKSVVKSRHAHSPETIRSEVEILFLLSGSPGIVQIYEVFEDEQEIHLIMELCSGGDWFDRLLEWGTYSEKEASEAVESVLRTLSYCHSLGVVHRDIKPENLLFDESGKVKLADFGLSAMGPEQAQEAANSNGQACFKLVGSAMYMAPEVLEGHSQGKERDIFALGVVLYITLSGYPPFNGNSIPEVFRAIRHQPLLFDDETWESISQDAKDFLRRMLNKDPKSRSSIRELLAHNWLKLNHDDVATTVRRVPDVVVARLRQFEHMNQLKKEARKLLAKMLPEEEVAGLLVLFRSMDTDDNGLITLAELHAALNSKGIRLTKVQAKELLLCADLNNDGAIDYEEFLAVTVDQSRLDKEDLLKKAFGHFDIDQCGFINQQDLQKGLLHLGLDVESVMHQVDQDGDGRINFEDFCKCMREREESHSSLWQLVSASTTPRRPSTMSTGGLCSKNARSRGIKAGPSRGYISDARRSARSCLGVMHAAQSRDFDDHHMHDDIQQTKRISQIRKFTGDYSPTAANLTGMHSHTGNNDRYPMEETNSSHSGAFSLGAVARTDPQGCRKYPPQGVEVENLLKSAIKRVQVMAANSYNEYQGMPIRLAARPTRLSLVSK